MIISYFYINSKNRDQSKIFSLIRKQNKYIYYKELKKCEKSYYSDTFLLNFNSTEIFLAKPSSTSVCHYRLDFGVINTFDYIDSPSFFLFSCLILASVICMQD